MNFILNNIVSSLDDDTEFYQILEVNHENGFVRVKALITGEVFEVMVRKDG